jgi:lysozyme
MTIVPGIDVSRYQGTVNWRVVADAGFKFAVVRATLWDVKLDETFETNWQGARANGLLVSAYNVIKPDVPAAAQIDCFAQALVGHKWDLPPVLDIERDDGQTPQQITQCVRESLRLSEQRFGRKPIVYTAKWFWNKFVLPSSEWAQYDLWVASYGAAEVVLPDAWPTWRIWQYTGNGHAPGIAGEVDLNWFNGSYDDLLKYCRATVPPVQGLRANAKTTLNVRNGPGINYVDIGDLAAGAEVTIGKVDGTDVWVQIEPGKWIALVYKGERNARTEAGSGGLQIRVLVDSLNVRSGPSVEQTLVEQLKKDAIAPLRAVDGKDAWGEIEPGKWIALAFKGEKYVEVM